MCLWDSNTLTLGGIFWGASWRPATGTRSSWWPQRSPWPQQKGLGLTPELMAGWNQIKRKNPKSVNRGVSWGFKNPLVCLGAWRNRSLPGLHGFGESSVTPAPSQQLWLLGVSRDYSQIPGARWAPVQLQTPHWAQLEQLACGLAAAKTSLRKVAAEGEVASLHRVPSVSCGGVSRAPRMAPIPSVQTAVSSGLLIVAEIAV